MTIEEVGRERIHAIVASVPIVVVESAVRKGRFPGWCGITQRKCVGVGLAATEGFTILASGFAVAILLTNWHVLHLWDETHATGVQQESRRKVAGEQRWT